MTERAAHLVDYVFPDVPVRQWVLTLPSRLRYALAWDHALCRAVVAVFVRAVIGWYRRQARQWAVTNGRGGAVVIVQRFGSALNLNVHLHALVLDGVFARNADGALQFHAASTHPAPDLMPLLVRTATRLQRLLTRRGIVDGGDSVDGWDPFAEDAPRAWHARVRGFDLHAAVAVRGGARDRLERMCRYALRPAVGQERLRISPEGQVVLDLRRRWADGTTHLVFDPVEFLERLAALVPRPRINLVVYHGVLAPRAAWREEVVPSATTDGAVTDAVSICRHNSRIGRRPNRAWAELMERSFGFDVLACPSCVGRMTLVALIRDPAVVGRILRHLGLPDAVPVPRAGRAPPLPWEGDAESEWTGVV